MRSIGSPSWIKRALGATPLAAPPHVFAVARRELRYGAFEADRAAGAMVFREFHAVPLPENAFGGGALGAPVGDPALLATALRALLGRISGRVRQASLVLPDAWVRALLVDFGVLPRPAEARSEVIRFRLRKLLPFRVEELRVAAAEVEPLPGQPEPIRALTLFSSESVVAALEAAFAGEGIRIGHLSNSCLSLVAGLDYRARLGGRFAAAMVQPEGFTLVFLRAGEPVLWRQKAFTDGISDADRATLLTRELRLTRSFLAESFGDGEAGPLFVAAPREVEPFWLGVLSEGLERDAIALRVEHLPLAAEGVALPIADVAPLVGAACREIA